MPSQKRNISHYKSNDNRDKTISTFIILQTTAEVCTDYTCSLHRLRRSLEIRKLSLHFIVTLTKTLVACSQNKDTEYISHNLSIMNTYSQFSVIRLNKYDLHN